MTVQVPPIGPGGDPDEPIPIPHELASLPPGVQLCELLEDLPVKAVSGHDTVDVVHAAYRQLCRQTALFYEALLETGLRKPFSLYTVDRLDRPSEFGSEEARAKLAWSRQRAHTSLGLAFDLFLRLPALGEAMLAGRLDLHRAKAFIEWTEGLSGTQANQVCTELIPTAMTVVVGELVDQIKRACLAIDPDWAEKKYKEAVKSRRVRGYRNTDGTGTLGGYSQPIDRVAAVCQRINSLARACKRAGDRRGIDLIRSDLYLRMLDGTFEAMTDRQIVDHVLANPLRDPTEVDDDGSGPDAGDPGHSGPDEPPAGPGPSADDDDGPTSGGAGDDGADSYDGDADSPTAGDETDGAAPGSAGDTGDGSDGRPAVEAPTRPARPAARQTAARGQAVPELRLQLTTLIGENDQPAQLPGWDYLPALLAHNLVERMHSAQWRWVVCDGGGYAIDGGLTRARPRTGSGAGSHRDPLRGGIVELAITATDLYRLAVDPAASGPWAPVVADIARQHASSTAGQDAEPNRRTPGSRLRRWVEVRARTCSHPYCRVPANSADIDHRTRWASGGRTVDSNLDPACRHDHRLKDEGHWRTRQPEPGTTVWTSPLGHEVVSRPPPVIPRSVSPWPRDRDPDQPINIEGWPDPCACLLRPCAHTRLERPRLTTHAAGQARTSATPEVPTLRDLLFGSRQPEPAMFDDGVPPF